MTSSAPFLAPDSWRTLDAGAGFGGATSEPSAVGDSGNAYYDCRPAMRWTDVPGQTYTERFVVGVLAFHGSGIDRVEFSLDNGTWLGVARQSRNDTTGLLEFCIGIDPASLSDGAHEVRAVAYPVAGIPRVAPGGIYSTGWKFWSNAGGTLGGGGILYVNGTTGSDSNNGTSAGTALATIKKALEKAGAASSTYNGGEIRIMAAGQYLAPKSLSASPTITRWLTIKADDSLAVGDVEIIGNGSTVTYMRAETDMIRMSRLKVDLITCSSIYPETGQIVWLDDCELYYSTGWTTSVAGETNPVRSGTTYYSTDCYWHDMLYGPIACALARGCTLYQISGDAFQNSTCVADCTLDTMDDVYPGWHCDVAQYFGTVDNVVFYGVKAKNIDATQCVFLDKDLSSTHTDVAFVNCAFSTAGAAVPPYSQHAAACKHVIFSHCSWDAQPVILRDDLIGSQQYVPTDCAFFNCVFYSFAMQSGGSIPAGLSMQGNHFITGSTAGSNTSDGTVTFSFDSGWAITYAGSDASDLVGTATALPKGLGIGSTSKGCR